LEIGHLGRKIRLNEATRVGIKCNWIGILIRRERSLSLSFSLSLHTAGNQLTTSQEEKPHRNQTE
jgi:hypothetical protein